ncbi:hypothetical protein [Rhizobium ruizarguesonis]|uniref:hypothetical protein n=1 Tax=Rhizobium ruizarguesonis TaxID=2081791 RepID=UPI0016AFD37A|nr:hypothetical protein [Rhizobium ruizarguesonis]NKQ85681.1 hypothetical protein [Rhizobium ruizarguesonis]
MSQRSDFRSSLEGAPLDEILKQLFIGRSSATHPAVRVERGFLRDRDALGPTPNLPAMRPG